MTRMILAMTRTDTEAFLKARDGNRCMLPGCDRPLDDPRDINTLDHIFPKFLARKKGWTQAQMDDIDNLQLMHKTCNARKGHLLPDENGNFNLPIKEPKPIRGPRPVLCELCFSGRLLLPGEECPECYSGPQPAKYPGSLQRKPKECDHSTYHCWMCVVDNPRLRVPAIERIISGP